MSAEADVLKTFLRFRDALLANDVDTLDALLAPDYRGYSLRGELEARDLILQAYSPGTVTMDRFETDDLRVETFGVIGIVTGGGFVEGSTDGERWQHELRFCDIYRHGEEGWQLYLSHATPVGASDP